MMNYRQQIIIVKPAGNEGAVAGLLGCMFGILGIFTIGIIFVPLAAVCSLFGLLRGLLGGSPGGIGCSLVGCVLTVWGFVFSPTLWLLVGAGFLATHSSATPVRATSPPTAAAGLLGSAPSSR
ncbi:MAG TPA: hypothetical protein VND95_10825 [Stellaceae bacterium]|nr:hypothetical protein [Stellaceae bacterium]